MTPSVILYSQDNCQPCKATKRALDQLEIPHVVQDVRAHPAIAEYLQHLGYNGTPVVVVATGEHWQGHRPDRLGALVA